MTEEIKIKKKLAELNSNYPYITKTIEEIQKHIDETARLSKACWSVTSSKPAEPAANGETFVDLLTNTIDWSARFDTVRKMRQNSEGAARPLLLFLQQLLSVLHSCDIVIIPVVINLQQETLRRERDMLGKIISGPYEGGSLCRAADKGAMYIQTPEGKPIYLNRNTVENLSNTPGPNGEKRILVTWKNGLTSIILLGGAPAKPQEPEVPAAPKAVEEAPKPVFEEPEEPEAGEDLAEEPAAEEEEHFEEAPQPVPAAAPAVPPVQQAAAPAVNRPVPPPVQQPIAPPVQQPFTPPVQPQFAAPVQQPFVPGAQPVKKDADFMHKMALKIVGIILGVVALVLALVVFGMNVGGYENSLSYGGDAYTGIQNAAAQTANNVRYLAEIVKFGFGSVLAMMGAVLLGGSLCINTKKPKV